MKQAVMTAPGTIEFRDVPAPQVGPGQVLLRIRRIGVCGSDVHVFHGRHPYTAYPVVQGHEFCATVEAVGEGVSAPAPGQKVTARPQVVCGACGPCRRGDYHVCEALKVWGFQTDGVAQEFFAAPVGNVVALPETFTFEQGAFVEPVAVAVHAAARAGDLNGRRAVVVGGGPIGNLVAQAVRAAGAEVLLTDLSAHRLEVARQCGLTRVSNAASEPLAEAGRRVFGADGFDLAFDCAGVEASINDAVACINKGGTVVVVAVFAERPRVDVGLVQDRELTVRGTLMYRQEDYLAAIEGIAAGRIVTDPLDSRHFDFEQYPQAYRFIDEAGAEAMKVFIDL